MPVGHACAQLALVYLFDILMPVCPLIRCRLTTWMGGGTLPSTPRTTRCQKCRWVELRRRHGSCASNMVHRACCTGSSAHP